MKYKRLFWTVIRAIVFMIISAMVAEVVMAYFLHRQGVKVSDKVHDIVMLAAIWGAFFLSMRRVIHELKILQIKQ